MPRMHSDVIGDAVSSCNIFHILQIVGNQSWIVDCRVLFVSCLQQLVSPDPETPNIIRCHLTPWSVEHHRHQSFLMGQGLTEYSHFIITLTIRTGLQCL